MTSYDNPFGPPPWASAPQPRQRPGVETRQILLTLGAFCLIVAFTAGTALVWSALRPGGQVGLMVFITAGLLAGAASIRRLSATAEALAAVGLVGCMIDAIAARTLHLSFATDVPVHTYISASAAVIALIAFVLHAAAPRLVAAPIGWSAASIVSTVAAETGASPDTRAFLAVALPIMAAAIVVVEVPERLRQFQIAAGFACGAPGVLAWMSLISGTQRFAVVNYALTVVAASVAAYWPRRRTDSMVVRTAALSATTLFASIAVDITLQLHHVATIEAYLATPAALTLAWGSAVLYRDRTASSAVLVPGLALGLLPTLLIALGDDHARQAFVIVAATVLVCIGAELRLSVPLTAGAGAIGLLGLRLIGPEVAQLPRWELFAAAGAILLTLGATWDARLEDARRIREQLRPQIDSLR